MYLSTNNANQELSAFPRGNKEIKNAVCKHKRLGPRRTLDVNETHLQRRPNHLPPGEFVRRGQGNFALCGERPKAPPLDSATFEKVDETFNLRPLGKSIVTGPLLLFEHSTVVPRLPVRQD